ncbi:MAG: rhomboid family intramembrane serine protease [Deltaproteobacteria bacterium]|nr:rhomboid family intramembrane serine protease [Deltaproteobacteria bacterium]
MTERFQLRKPPFWTRGIVIALMAAALVISAISGSFSTGSLLEDLAHTVISLGAFLTVGGSILALRLLRLPRTPPFIALGAEEVELPIKADSRRSMKVPFRDLRTVDLRFAPPEGFLIIESAHRTFFFRLRDFATPTDLPRFGELLRERLHSHPDGPAILATLAIESDRMRATIARPTRATMSLVILLTVVYAFQLLVDGVDHATVFLRMGAGHGLLVRGGEYYRLITANLLHGPFWHYGLNVFFFYMLGNMAERVMGTWRFVVAYLVAGLAGASLSAYFFTERFSVGSSGCIYGIIGAYAVLSLRHPRTIPAGFRIRKFSWWFLAIVSIVPPLLVPIIDWAAHLGGFLAGALAAALLSWSPRSIEPGHPTPGWIRALALSLVALWLAGTAAAIDAGLRGDFSLLREVAALESVDAESTNALAWMICIDERADRGQLRSARDGAQIAVQRSGNAPHVRDTLAQCLHRLGDAAEAARVELAVVEASLGDPNAGNYATQVGRFTRALEPPDAIHLGEIQIESRDDGIALRAEPAGASRLLWFEVFEGARAVGMLRLCLGPDRIEEETRMPVGAPGEAALGDRGWPRQARLEPRLLRSKACEPPDSGWNVYYWPPDDRAAALP